MSRFIDTETFAEARSRSGRSYTGLHIFSQTHMHDIPAELAALVRAMHENDLEISEVLATGTGPVSPLVLKILADHGIRTGVPVAYTLRTPAGEVVFKTGDARETLPFYVPAGAELQCLSGRQISSAKITDDSKTLRELAIAGMGRNFPTREGASGYGAALRIANGDIYFGGQYSAYDERLGVHAEMAVLASALADGAAGFTDIAIASSKFPESPALPCGCCLQFLSEAVRATKSQPLIHLFASEGEQSATYSLDELLPVQWTNRK